MVPYVVNTTAQKKICRLLKMATMRYTPKGKKNVSEINSVQMNVGSRAGGLAVVGCGSVGRRVGSLWAHPRQGSCREPNWVRPGHKVTGVSEYIEALSSACMQGQRVASVVCAIVKKCTIIAQVCSGVRKREG